MKGPGVEPAPPRLVMRGVRKSYGGVHALRGVDLEVRAGEVHALLGENGAGKSTLMKVLSGAVRPDGGAMELDGAPYAPDGPRGARARGVAMIYQELELCPHLSVLENVTLGEERARAGVVRPAAARGRLVEVLGRLGVDGFGPDTAVGTLGPGDRQLVEIARALMADARVVVFDEPTSSLSPPEVARLFDVARGLAARGVAAIWISHFLHEVDAVCQRYTVLRGGETVVTGEVAAATHDQWLAAMNQRGPNQGDPVRMIGREGGGSRRFPGQSFGPGPLDSGPSGSLEVTDLTGRHGVPAGASFTLRPGEILGLFGLVGAGRTELLRVLYGLDPAARGTVSFGGYQGPPLAPRAWLERGVGMLSEDRAHEGLFLELSLAENVTASTPRPLGARRAAFERWRAALGIRAGDAADAARTLSGGNQQKVALARLLHHGAAVLLLDEPTRGIDVGAKEEVYALLARLRDEGRAILMVSSYTPELLRACDRIAVMHRGRLGAPRPTEEWTEESLLAAATGSAEGAAHV